MSAADKPRPYIREMAQEIALECAKHRDFADLLRELANNVDGRTAAQISESIRGRHGNESLAWLLISREHIAGMLKLLALTVALDAKEHAPGRLET